MPVPRVRVNPEPYREFVAAVDQFVEEAREPRSRVAGLLYAGLLFAARRLEELGEPGGFAVSGP